MDNNTIAILEDDKKKIEKKFESIEKELKEHTGKDASLKNRVLILLDSVEKYLIDMEMQISCLKDENNMNEREGIKKCFMINMKNIKREYQNRRIQKKEKIMIFQ